MTAKVTSKGRVTLPKAVRDLLGIGPGSVIDFERAPDGRIMLVKVDGTRQPNRFEKLRGRAGKGLSTDEIMALMRGED
ncbi:MAG: AbrB/MazE/SpoVT family DNA-binding domain-containing protein [Roseiarcus sp.]